VAARAVILISGDPTVQARTLSGIEGDGVVFDLWLRQEAGRMIRRWLIRSVAITSIAACVAAGVTDTVRGWPGGGHHLVYGATASIFVMGGTGR
jgi:hypothetical protein